MGAHLRPTVARVDLSAIVHNYNHLRRTSPASQVLVAVKANAYGHGAVRVAQALTDAGCRWLAVATVEEGLELRAHGVEASILVFGGPGRCGADALVSGDLTAVIHDVHGARHLNAAARRQDRVVPVHLQVDTGMSRLGAPPSDWEAFVEQIEALDHLHIDGVMTHLARADDSADRTATQVETFRTAVDQLHQRGHTPTFVHADNSAGALHYAHGLNLVRAGIAAYGIQPSGAFSVSELRPAMSLHTEVLTTRWVEAGTQVSYGGTWTAPTRTHLAVLPVGYGDGYSRALSGKASVLIAGQRAPIRGRVCMDLVMVDVTHIEEPVRMGTPVVLMGSQGTARVSAEELAEHAGTIGYEVVTCVGSRVPRVWMGA